MFRLTPTVKNLLIINVVVFVASFILGGLNLSERMAMYRIGSAYFEPYQIFTYMFAHAGFMHILFNMFGLVIFGVSLEMAWGARKFLTYYLITGIGSGVFYLIIGYTQIAGLQSDLQEYRDNPTVVNFMEMTDNHQSKLQDPRISEVIYRFIDQYEQEPDKYREESVQMTFDLERILITEYPIRVIGASGAVYGILMAFGLLFPERQLMLLFPPIPIKAKYLVLILGIVALYSGLQNNPGDPVAHLVHLGGMVVGFIMVKFF